MQPQLKVIFSQLNPTVGDIDKNKTKVINTIKKFCQDNTHTLVVFPELFLTGYPPEDLLFRQSLHEKITQACQEITSQVTTGHCILGLPKKTKEGLYNAAAYITQKNVQTHYFKNHLPNQEVFDEKRYFKAGKNPLVIEINNIRIALNICEDFWHESTYENIKTKNPDILISINASPFTVGKQQHRLSHAKKMAKKYNLPIFYLNTVGGQDELLFDGASFGCDSKGAVTFQSKSFCEDYSVVSLAKSKKTIIINPQNGTQKQLSDNDQLYEALVLSLKDYLNKSNFKRVFIGLSGGIDSALVASIACDAIGPKNVYCVMMKTKHTSSLSIRLAKECAKLTKANYQAFDIQEIFDSYQKTLNPKESITKQNLQARIRGNILMALANEKTTSLVLATGNRSELATGYCTLYGDMVGAYCVLKNVFKTDVYKLSSHRNTKSKMIPEEIINRKPTAELEDNQLDEDTLPPYNILDEILKLSLDKEKSVQEIIESGFDKKTVEKTVTSIYRNEFKRRQASLGTQVDNNSFGRWRRYPVTSSFAD